MTYGKSPSTEHGRTTWTIRVTRPAVAGPEVA